MSPIWANMTLKTNMTLTANCAKRQDAKEVGNEKRRKVQNHKRAA